MELKRLAAGFILVLGTMIHPHAEGEVDTAGIEFDFENGTEEQITKTGMSFCVDQRLQYGR